MHSHKPHVYGVSRNKTTTSKKCTNHGGTRPGAGRPRIETKHPPQCRTAHYTPYNKNYITLNSPPIVHITNYILAHLSQLPITTSINPPNAITTPNPNAHRQPEHNKQPINAELCPSARRSNVIHLCISHHCAAHSSFEFDCSQGFGRLVQTSLPHAWLTELSSTTLSDTLQHTVIDTPNHNPAESMTRPSVDPQRRQQLH